MHQQIRGSPGDTTSNVHAIVTALAGQGINVLGIAPDFDPPHVRVVVADTDVDAAMSAMADAGLAPQIRSAVQVGMANQPKHLKDAMDRLARKGYVVESVIVLSGTDDRGLAQVSFGIREAGIPGWTDTRSEELGEEIGDGLES
jgi:hypothetical protein